MVNIKYSQIRSQYCQMYDKLVQHSIYKHRIRKNKDEYSRMQLLAQQKNQNLKQLQQTFLHKSKQNQNFSRQLIFKPLIKQNQIVQKELDKEIIRVCEQNEKMKHFYVNADKLRRLKNSSQQKPHKIASSSVLKSSVLAYEKKNLIVKSYKANSQPKRHLNSSHQSKNNQYQKESQNKLSQHNPPKINNRYKTQIQEQQVQKEKPTNKSYQNIVRRSQNKKQKDDIADKKVFIQGYLRGKQIGRGGFSKVWEGFHYQKKLFYAIKEIDVRNKYQTHLTQIWFGNYFFENGKPKIQHAHHQGIKRLLTMQQYQIINPHAFIVYQCCEGSIGNMLYDIYEEDHQQLIDEDDKVYMIKYRPLYLWLGKSCDFIKSLIYQISQALDLLAINNIIHSDIKTQNILIKQQYDEKHFNFKLIDYGSSFVYQNLTQYKLATPEYMCPELLNYILYQNGKQCHHEMLRYVKKYQNVSAIDVWGLGCIVIEIIHGLPLWLNNRTRIIIKGKYQTKRGLFAVSDRSFNKILQKQLELIGKFQEFIEKDNNSGVVIDNTLKSILKRMLQIDPMQRIRPKQIIQILKKENPSIR